MKKKNLYSKPTNRNKALWSSIRILLVMSCLAVIGIVGFFAVKDGWAAVIAWFTSRWACLVAIVLIFGITAALFLVNIIRNMKGVHDED